MKSFPKSAPHPYPSSSLNPPPSVTSLKTAQQSISGVPQVCLHPSLCPRSLQAPFALSSPICADQDKYMTLSTPRAAPAVLCSPKNPSTLPPCHQLGTSHGKITNPSIPAPSHTAIPEATAHSAGTPTTALTPNPLQVWTITAPSPFQPTDPGRVTPACVRVRAWCRAQKQER